MMTIFNGHQGKVERYHKNGVIAWKGTIKNHKYQGRQYLCMDDGTPVQKSIFLNDRTIVLEKYDVPKKK